MKTSEHKVDESCYLLDLCPNQVSISMYFISSVTSVFVLKRLNKDIHLKLLCCLGYFFLSAFSFRLSGSCDSSFEPPSQSHPLLTSVRCILLGRTGEKRDVPHPEISVMETSEKNQNTSHIGVKEDGLQKQTLEDASISKADEHFFTLLFIVNNIKCWEFFTYYSQAVCFFLVNLARMSLQIAAHIISVVMVLFLFWCFPSCSY